MTSSKITEALAAEVAETDDGDIPDRARRAIETLILDHVGIAYMGAALTGAPLIAFARDQGGRADAVLLGSDLRVPAALAAGLNGQFSRATNFEETGPGRHIGPLCVHTALAVGQRVGTTGRAMVTAAALGYLHCARFHQAVRANNGMAHHRTTAAAIAARLHGFDRRRTARALNLAWEMPHRFRADTSSRVATLAFEAKRISPFGTPGPLATPFFHARHGIEAALLVAHGLTSVEAEIDRDRADYDVPGLLRQPPPFDLIGRMELKPWPCNRPGQCAIQALSDLLQDHAIDPDTVTELRLHVPRVSAVPHQVDPAPDTYWEAIYSIHWAAAMVVLGIPAGPKWVTASRLRDPRARRLAAMVEVREDREATLAYEETRRDDVLGSVEIVAAGRSYRAQASLGQTLGSPNRPMSAAAIDAKFREASSLALTPTHAERLITALRSIDTVVDVGELAALLVVDQTPKT